MTRGREYEDLLMVRDSKLEVAVDALKYFISVEFFLCLWWNYRHLVDLNA